jgi:hypothetical protein
MRDEQRRHPRYPIAWELRGKALPPLERAGDRSLVVGSHIRGVITDIGAGGIGVFSEDGIEISDPFVGWIIVPQVRVGIPTLVQVRWALRDGQGRTYRLGVQFLV